MQTISETLSRVLRQSGELLKSTTESCDQSHWIEAEERRAAFLNSRPGELPGDHCERCLDRGYIYRVDEHSGIYAEECSCMIARRSMRRIRESGLSDLLERYTFEAWRSSEDWQRHAYDTARRFSDDPVGWLYFAGRPGTGKTHLCTAVCGDLLRRGFPVRYVLWRDFSTKAKASISDAEQYGDLIEPLKNVRALYIDDLFKGGSTATSADVNLAFELLGARYNDERKITILSSEMTISQITAIDEGLGSRIFQRSKDHYADLRGRANYRLKTGEQTKKEKEK